MFLSPPFKLEPEYKIPRQTEFEKKAETSGSVILPAEEVEEERLQRQSPEPTGSEKSEDAPNPESTTLRKR